MANETGWLIEAPWEIGEPSYLGVLDFHDNHGLRFAWSTYYKDHVTALRFARKQDAELFVAALYKILPQLFLGPNPVPMPRIVDHQWSEL